MSMEVIELQHDIYGWIELSIETSNKTDEFAEDVAFLLQEHGNYERVR